MLPAFSFAGWDGCYRQINQEAAGWCLTARRPLGCRLLQVVSYADDVHSSSTSCGGGGGSEEETESDDEEGRDDSAQDSEKDQGGRRRRKQQGKQQQQKRRRRQSSSEPPAAAACRADPVLRRHQPAEPASKPPSATHGTCRAPGRPDLSELCTNLAQQSAGPSRRQRGGRRRAAELGGAAAQGAQARRQPQVRLRLLLSQKTADGIAAGGAAAAQGGRRVCVWQSGCRLHAVQATAQRWAACSVVMRYWLALHLPAAPAAYLLQLPHPTPPHPCRRPTRSSRPSWRRWRRGWSRRGERRR
jgi:hypothetical protein